MKRKAGGQGSKKAGALKGMATKKRGRVLARKSASGRAYNPQVGGFSRQRKSRMAREGKQRAAIERRDARAAQYEADGMSPQAAMARAQKELWED
jgi:hypothetical protein